MRDNILSFEMRFQLSSFVRVNISVQKSMEKLQFTHKYGSSLLLKCLKKKREREREKEKEKDRETNVLSVHTAEPH